MPNPFNVVLFHNNGASVTEGEIEAAAHGLFMSWESLLASQPDPGNAWSFDGKEFKTNYISASSHKVKICVRYAKPLGPQAIEVEVKHWNMAIGKASITYTVSRTIVETEGVLNSGENHWALWRILKAFRDAPFS